MPFGALIPLVTAALSVGGGMAANRAQQRSADRQMAFQREMSNTAIQRQVKDFEAAGLNPALAYGAGGASSPSGQSATFEDPVQKGISNARDTAALRQQMQLAKAETESRIRLQTAQTAATQAQGQESLNRGDLALWQARTAQQQFGFNDILFPAASRQAMANAILAELQQGLTRERVGLTAAEAARARMSTRLDTLRLPQLEAEARWSRRAGEARPAIQDILNAIGSITGSARNLSPFINH